MSWSKAPYGITICVLIIMALFFVWLRVEQVRYGYMIFKAYEQYLDLQRTHKKLILQWNYLTIPSRLEEIAERELGMRPPQPDEIVFLGIPEKLLETDDEGVPPPREDTEGLHHDR